MFGFLSCAEARGKATMPSATKAAATPATKLPMRFMNFLLLLFQWEEKRPPLIFSLDGGPQTKTLSYPGPQCFHWELSKLTVTSVRSLAIHADGSADCESQSLGVAEDCFRLT
jgi:hypothetical protein